MFRSLLSKDQSLLRGLLTLVAGVVFIALAAQATVPMVPVPMTLQTYAVLLVGALLGWRKALVVLGGYVLAAACGLPVLADGASGIERLVGPTAGYILGFFLAGWLVGLEAVRAKVHRSLLYGLVVMVIGHLVILVAGFGWLGLKIGWRSAFEHGVQPFLLAAVVKALLVALTVKGIASLRNRTIPFS